MILAIETAQMNFSIACLSADICREDTWSDVSITLDDKVRELLFDIDLSALSVIIVNIGPGGFSGIRSGVSFAIGLAEALGIGMYPVTSFDVIAEEVSRSDPFYTAVDARKQQCYLQHRMTGEHNEPVLSPLEELGALKDPIYGTAPNDNCTLCTPHAAVMAKMAQKMLENHIETVKPSAIKPIYIRSAV